MDFGDREGRRSTEERCWKVENTQDAVARGYEIREKSMEGKREQITAKKEANEGVTKRNCGEKWLKEENVEEWKKKVEEGQLEWAG